MQAFGSVDDIVQVLAIDHRAMVHRRERRFERRMEPRGDDRYEVVVHDPSCTAAAGVEFAPREVRLYSDAGPGQGS